ncbi:MAG: hypothetical protein KGK03_06770 [Candidatus Omnitrophica bacterium]|nr:hypothetical protein [Candidatus Omnitrophota bacterium]
MDFNEKRFSYIANKDKKAESLTSLDKDGNNRNKLKCACRPMSLIGARESEERWLHLRVYCKRWVCPKCGPQKASKLRKAIIKKASEKDLRRLLTLTLDPSKCKAEESIPYIKKCWNKMRTYLKRKFGKNISFIAVLELQKSGYAHLHILIDRYVDQAWASEAWQAIGGGRIVHLRSVDIHRVTHYLSKYLTKSMFLEHYGKNRRYTTSRDLTLKDEDLKPKIKTTWRLLNCSIESLLKMGEFEALNKEEDFSGNLRSFETFFSLIERFDLKDFVLK